VPDHERIVDNERADQLARTGSEHPFIGPEPACGISVGVSKKSGQGLDEEKSQKSASVFKISSLGLVF
jgi:hypothetical protein